MRKKREASIQMHSEPRPYQSYLLRLWQTSNAGELVWRASLESPHTGQRHGFANLDALLAYLRVEFRDQQNDPMPPQPSHDGTQTGPFPE
jgi:hypothetical protein